MKKLFNIVYLSAWMLIVIMLLIFSMVRDSITSLLNKKKSRQDAKNQLHKKENKSTKYIITERSTLRT